MQLPYLLQLTRKNETAAPGEIRRQWRKWIRRCNAVPRRTIQGNIARDGHQTHVRNSAFFRDGKLNRKFALLHLVGFRDKFEAVIFHVRQHALHVRTEIHASRIAQNFDGSRLTPVGTYCVVKAVIRRFLVRGAR